MRGRFIRHARQSCRAACLLIRVVDPHWFNADADPDPNPAFFLIADQNPDPDPNADPEPVPDSGLWWPKIKKIYSWKLLIFLIKNCIFLSLNLPKGRPSYRRSLQPSKKCIQHFKPWKFFFFYFFGWFLPSWNWISILHTDPDLATQIKADPQPCS